MEVPAMYYKLYRDAAGYHRWTLYSANHRKIADSGEGYVNRNDCLHAIDLVKGSSSAPVYE
jgi:uncharacterized protein